MEIRKGVRVKKSSWDSISEERVGDMRLDEIIKAEGWSVGKRRPKDSSLGAGPLFKR